MLTPHKKWLIKRNILAFRWMYDKMLGGNGFKKTMIDAGEQFGFSKNLAEKIYSAKKYGLSPHNIYDEQTGEIIGQRTHEQIIQEAINIERAEENTEAA